MQIIFLIWKKSLLELLAPFQNGEVHNVADFDELKNLIDLGYEGPTIIFADFDDPNFEIDRFGELFLQNASENGLFHSVLLSGSLSIKEFKKIQSQFSGINALLRAPIKLKDIETFVEDYMLVFNETRDPMAEPKKKEFEDPMNDKIQKKFDLVFSKPMSSSNEHKSTVFNHGIDNSIDDDDFLLEGDSPMSNNSAKIPDNGPSLDLSFDSGSELSFDNNAEEAVPPVTQKTKEPTKLSVVPDDAGLEFSLDFGDDSPEIPAMPAAKEQVSVPAGNTKSDSHFELDLSGDDNSFELDGPAAPAVSAAQKNTGTASLSPAEDDSLDTMFDDAIADAKNHMSSEGTQKTIVYDKSQLTDIGIEKFEMTGSTNSSADMMSTEEAKANIDATIKDILRPKNLDSTQEFDIGDLSADDADFSNFEIETAKSSPGTPSLGFNLKNIPTQQTTNNSSSATGEFDLSSVEFGDKEDTVQMNAMVEEVPEVKVRANHAPKSVEAGPETHTLHSPHNSFISDEESSRVQATIRQLREERENLINQLKMQKGETRELEQDNLTLKAALDETKIEVSILRKRHMVELEDMKYRLQLNEEKKAMAIEAARLSESKREKLEQRVRIDFNQVKQREKELESKLEMLSIDVDSQVQSRDQKILELRRKIDSLEFNMENVSIKEQKSEDDKRKLEDKLNKIMKTLRHSIKNLEDDIDQANDEAQDNRNNNQRSNKA